jgi:hypothetical protein
MSRLEATTLCRAVGLLSMVFIVSSCAAIPPITSTYDPGRLLPVDPSGATEESVSSNRTGVGTVVTIDELVTCASRRQDMAGPSNCLRLQKEVKERFPPSAIRLCAHHVNGTGNLVFDDPRSAPETRTQEGASVENVDVSGDTAFFDRYMTKAVKQVVEAEVSGLQAHEPEMLRHAELALDHATEAQRERNVPGLVEGLVELRAALGHRQSPQWEGTLDHIRHARVALSAAAGMNPDDTHPQQDSVSRH